jgi:hypothetical protein
MQHKIYELPAKEYEFYLIIGLFAKIMENYYFKNVAISGSVTFLYRLI